MTSNLKRRMSRRGYFQTQWVDPVLSVGRGPRLPTSDGSESGVDVGSGS